MSGDTMTNSVVTIMVAVVTAGGASLVGGWLQRPKTKADASAAVISAEVSMSAEAREWARDAMDRLTAADKKAEATNLKLEAANAKLDALEERFDQLVQHVHACHLEIVRNNGKIPDLPAGVSLT